MKIFLSIMDTNTFAAFLYDANVLILHQPSYFNKSNMGVAI